MRRGPRGLIDPRKTKAARRGDSDGFLGFS
nr:MAG TPA: hypothetical protein [Caudoviricetes sp.]